MKNFMSKSTQNIDIIIKTKNRRKLLNFILNHFPNLNQRKK